MPNTENYELDPNFAVVCSFIEKFGSLFGEQYRDLSIESLKAFLEVTEVDTKDLFVKFHITLIRGVFRYCKPVEFEKKIIKFCKDFSDGDDKLVKSIGYGKIPATVKLRILKNLCEDQFQYSDRFNRQVNEILSEEGTIRHEPVGKDRLGRSYWFVLDTSSGLRLFRGWHNELTCDETWNVVCREIGELQELIELLEENENLSNDDKALHAQPNLPSPKKISPTELLSAANEDAAKAMYFSSICSSPRFIKSPRRRTKAEVRRDERRHELPHCKVKLSRLTKSDFEKWKTNDKRIGNIKHENLINLRSEKCIKAGKLNFERTVNAIPDITRNKNKVEEVNIKKETENIAECLDVSSLKIVAKEDKTDSVDKNACKPNEIKSASPNHCPVQKIDLKDSNIKCTLKTDTIERTNVTVHEQPCPLKDEEHGICNDVLNVSKFAQSWAGSSQNLSKTYSESNGSDSHVKTEQSSVKKVSVTDSDKIRRSGRARNCENENDNKVHEKKAIVVSKEKPKQSGKVSGDLDKCPEENASVIINGTGDASSSRGNITSCKASEVQNGKLAAEDKTVINSAENSQDLKEAISTDNKTNDSEKDIFNAAIKDLLTLESKVLDSSVVTIHNQTKCTSARTPTKEEEDIDSSESDKKVLDKALKDLIQLEMMTQGSAMDEVCPANNNSFNDTEPANKSAKEVSTVSTTEAELECIVNTDSKSAKAENGVSEKYIARVNVKSECSNSKGDTKESLAENEGKKMILGEIKNKSESSSIKPVNLKEKQNMVKVDLKAQIVKSSHKSWTNLSSAERYTQNLCNSSEKRNSSELSTNIVIPSKSCDAEPNDANFLTKVMSIIHGKSSEENVLSQALDKTKCNSEKNEKLTANVDGEKSATDNDMNILVGDEMIRIEVANSSSSDDADSADDGTDTTKGVNAASCKEKSVSKTSTSMNIDLSMEKAAINSLYSDTLLTNTKVSKSDTVLSPPLQTVPKQVVTSVPKVVVRHAFPPPGPNVIKLVSVNSGVAPIQQLILPAKSAIALPKFASSHLSSSIGAVIIRPTVSLESSKPALVSLLKSSSSSFVAPQSSPSIVIAPFNALPQVTNPVRWIPGTVSQTSRVQGSLNTVVRPQLKWLPQSLVPRFVVPNRFVSAGNPSVIKMSLPGQTLVSSNNLNSFTVAGQQSVTGLVYVRSGVSPNVSLSSTNHSSSTVKLALKKHLEAPIPKVCVSSDKELKKTQQPLLPKCAVFIGIDGVHYNAATNQPLVHPPNKRYVIAGPGGKFYDKESGYQMDVPLWNNLRHIPGKVYLATNAKFSNEITKPQQKTKKKSKKKKATEFREDTSDEEFEKMLEESEVEMSESNDDEDYDYEKISKRVKTAKNLKLPSRRVSLESEEHDSEMEVDSDVDTVPVVLGRNAKRVAARQLNCYGDKKEVVVDEESDDGVDACKVCGSSRNPATILLCDECDEGYHMSCLSPPLSVVPSEDWFCSNCQHNMLVAALKKKLELAKKAYRQARRTGRTISPTAFSINSSNILETERRSCRNRKEVSYRDDKFDRMVVDAVKEFNSVKKRKMSSSSSGCSSSEDESKTQPKSGRKAKLIGNTTSDQKLKSDRKGSKQANDQKKKHAPVRTTRSDTKREDDIPVRTTRSDSKMEDDIPVRTTRSDTKREDDIPVRTTRSDSKMDDDIPIRTTRSDTKREDDTPVRTTRSDSKREDDIPIRTTRSDTKRDDDTPVRTTRSDTKMDDDIPVRTTRSDTKREDTPVGLTRSNSKMDEDTPVRSTRSDTKREEGDRSSSVKHKKTKLTGTDVVSDDSGSEYVQSDNSSNSDLEDSTSVEAVSPEKKTYLTLSGRATKNVSYK